MDIIINVFKFGLLVHCELVDNKAHIVFVVLNTSFLIQIKWLK